MEHEKNIADQLTELFVSYKDELPYANLNDKNQYMGWVQDFRINIKDQGNIKLDLSNENDLFLLFVLAIVWSRSGPWENSAYFVAYLKIFEKSSPPHWKDTKIWVGCSRK